MKIGKEKQKKNNFSDKKTLKIVEKIKNIEKNN